MGLMLIVVCVIVISSNAQHRVISSQHHNTSILCHVFVTSFRLCRSQGSYFCRRPHAGELMKKSAFTEADKNSLNTKVFSDVCHRVV